MSNTDNDLESIVRTFVTKIDNGVPLDWTDLRIYLIIMIASLLGTIIGTYFTKFYGKRGEINAIKKDLDEITKTQEEIRSKISTETIISQKWWDLKREVYWKATITLNRLSDAHFNVLMYCFDKEKKKFDDPKIYIPYRDKLLDAYDEFLNLTGISYIVMCDEGIAEIERLGAEAAKVHRDMNGSTVSYDQLEVLRQSVDRAYDKIIEIARKDLKGVRQNNS